MLEKQEWMRYAPSLLTEWQQLWDEGLDVGGYQERCREIAQRADDAEADAQALFEQMAKAPLRPDYPYLEPSDYREILRCLPAPAALPGLDGSKLGDKIAGAWTGRIAGCLLGKPLEGLRMDRIMPILRCTGNYPMNRYVDSRDFTDDLRKRVNLDALEPWQKCWADTIGGAAPVDDDTNYTVFALKLVESYGKGFRSADVMEGWLQWIPMLATCTAERVAYRNAACGLLPPRTATWQNPYREWIGAQIRGDFFGYINPGSPREAAEMAFRDACISHVKNGIYGEMYIAAMIAAAACCAGAEAVVQAGLREIPPASRLAKGVEQVLAWHKMGCPWQDTAREITSRWDEWNQYHWCHTVSNAMIVTAALLYGEGDFAKSICLAVQTGFDTDCNGATVGSVAGMLAGRKAIPPVWYNAFQDTLRTSIDGYQNVTVAQLTEKTIKIIEGKTK